MKHPIHREEYATYRWNSAQGIRILTSSPQILQPGSIDFLPEVAQALLLLSTA